MEYLVWYRNSRGRMVTLMGPCGKSRKTQIFTDKAEAERTAALLNDGEVSETEPVEWFTIKGDQ